MYYYYYNYNNHNHYSYINYYYYYCYYYLQLVHSFFRSIFAFCEICIYNNYIFDVYVYISYITLFTRKKERKKQAITNNQANKLANQRQTNTHVCITNIYQRDRKVRTINTIDHENVTKTKGKTQHKKKPKLHTNAISKSKSKLYIYIYINWEKKSIYVFLFFLPMNAGGKQWNK